MDFITEKAKQPETLEILDFRCPKKLRPAIIALYEYGYINEEDAQKLASNPTLKKNSLVAIIEAQPPKHKYSDLESFESILYQLRSPILDLTIESALPFINGERTLPEGKRVRVIELKKMIDRVRGDINEILSTHGLYKEYLEIQAEKRARGIV